MRSLAYALSSLSLISLLACAPGEGGDAGPDGGGTSFDVYAPGMSKTGESLTFTLVEAVPGPPVPTEDNTWTVRVTGANDAAVEGLEVVLTPFMPEHDHGTTPPDFEGAPAATAGEYSVGPFVLPMPGFWEFTLSADDGADVSDEVVFRFDVES